MAHDRQIEVEWAGGAGMVMGTLPAGQSLKALVAKQSMITWWWHGDEPPDISAVPRYIVRLVGPGLKVAVDVDQCRPVCSTARADRLR